MRFDSNQHRSKAARALYLEFTFEGVLEISRRTSTFNIDGIARRHKMFMRV
jgi:hypothetical protein